MESEESHEFEVVISRQDVDVALKRFIFRGAGKSALVGVLCCVAYLAYDFSAGGVGLLSICILVLLGLLILLFLSAWMIRRRKMHALVDQLGKKPVSYFLYEGGIGVESTIGDSHLRWDQIKKLWIDPDVVMLFYSRNAYATIPTRQIPREARDFLETTVRAKGGKVLTNL